MTSLSKTFCNSLHLTQISALVYDENNNLYACNFGSPTASIIKINPDGEASVLINHEGSDRNFVSMVYLKHFLYVTGFNNCVYKVNIDNGDISIFVTLPENGTNGIAHLNGAFYVVCMNANCMQTGNIYKINMDGTYSIFISEDKLGGTQYNIIATDKDGNFYITDEGQNAVVKYNIAGELIDPKFITGEFQSILIHNNHIYVTNYLINQISQYNIDGKLINKEFAIGGLTFAGGGMAFNKHDDFYYSMEVNSGEAIIQIMQHQNKDNHNKDIN